MAYTPDASNVDRPTGGDLVQIPEELRAIKARIGQETAGKMDVALPVQKVYPIGSTGIATTATTTIDLSNGTFQHFRAVQDTTFSFSAPTLQPGYTPFFTLKLTNGGNHDITWPVGTKFPNGTNPLLTSDGVDILVFFQAYPGSPWEGTLVMRDVKVPS